MRSKASISAVPVATRMPTSKSITMSVPETSIVREVSAKRVVQSSTGSSMPLGP